MSIKITDELSLTEFKFWGGAEDRVKCLTFEQLEQLTDIFEEQYPDGIGATELNDIFWFEDDYIAQLLGYDSWESLENGDEEDEDEEEEDEEGEDEE